MKLGNNHGQLLIGLLTGVAITILVCAYADGFFKTSAERSYHLLNSANSTSDADTLIAMVKNDFGLRNYAGSRPAQVPASAGVWQATTNYFNNPAQTCVVGTSTVLGCGDFYVRKSNPGGVIGLAYYQTTCPTANNSTTWTDIGSISQVLDFNVGDTYHCANTTRPLVTVTNWTNETTYPANNLGDYTTIFPTGANIAGALSPTAFGMIACFRQLATYTECSPTLTYTIDGYELDIYTIPFTSPTTASPYVVQSRVILNESDKSTGVVYLAPH